VRPAATVTDSTFAGLAAARALWVAHDADAYRLEYTEVCFCYGDGGPWVVSVRDGHVVDLHNFSARGGRDPDYRPWTVERLFEEIEATIGLESDFEPTTFTYDAATGLPLEVNVATQVYDGGTSVTVHGYERFD
jgi:hypothetical protein